MNNCPPNAGPASILNPTMDPTTDPARPEATPPAEPTESLPALPGTPTSFADLCTELDNGRPLGVRIGWSGGGGHFNVVGCYTANPLFGLQSLEIEDPWYGTSVWDYDTFRTAYQGTGSWTHSYKTQA